MGFKRFNPLVHTRNEEFRKKGERKERKEEGGTEMRTTRGIINLTQGMEFRDKISLKFYSGWSSQFLFVIAGWEKRSRCDIFPSEILKQPLET